MNQTAIKALVMFRNDSLTNQFMAEVIQYGTFARCFGLMSYPMMLGIFSVMSIAFFVFAEIYPGTLAFTFFTSVFALFGL